MKIFKYESSSSTAMHTVRVADDGRVSCSCRGFSTPNKCWHVRDTATKLGVTGTATHFGFTLDNYTPGVSADSPFTEKFGVGLPAIKKHLGTDTGFIEPMLASALKEGASIEDFKSGWLLEEKFDGHRMIVQVDRSSDRLEITAWSRGNKQRQLPDHILAGLENMPDGTYDGELYWPGGTSTDVTRLDLQSKLHLVLFDILRVVNYNAMDRPAFERRTLLEASVTRLDTDYIYAAKQFEVSRVGLQAIWDRGGEGAIIKNMHDKYLPGKRIKGWVKFKKENAAEVIITGFLPGRLGPHSVIVGVDQFGVEVQVKTLNDQWRAEFAKNAAAYLRGRTLVISYQEKTRDGRYRHPMADHIL